MQTAASSSDGLHPATAAFRSHLPSALQSISPSLAALHVARTRLLGPPGTSQDTFTSTHCPHCGAYMLNGDGVTRTMRKKRRNRVDHSTPLEYVRRMCTICGHVQDTRIDHGIASHYPSVRRRAAGKASAPGAEENVTVTARNSTTVNALPSPSGRSVAPSSGPSSRASSVHLAAAPRTSRSSTPIPTCPTSRSAALGPPEPQKSKPRPKKKTGLQDILARNRERQERERQAGGSGGLAAFLENL